MFNGYEVENLKMEIIKLKDEIWQYKKDRIMTKVNTFKIEKGKQYTSIVELSNAGIFYSYDIPALYDTYTKEEILTAINEYAYNGIKEEAKDEKDA